jgi:hypothetical protein
VVVGVVVDVEPPVVLLPVELVVVVGVGVEVVVVVDVVGVVVVLPFRSF